jgi:hypothetical protein
MYILTMKIITCGSGCTTPWDNEVRLSDFGGALLLTEVHRTQSDYKTLIRRGRAQQE